MPLIAGNKYSCEPCIRGHRATHCAHTDRLLIEVRKPGRPLDRCCHKLNSCTCGRLTTSSSLPLSSPSPKAVVVELEKVRVGKEVGEGEGEVRISKEQPFGRELRLSVSGESRGVDGKGGERRRVKVFKRHRLGRENLKSGSDERGGRGLDLEVDTEMGGEEPELSPSLSSSESEEGSKSPEVRGMELIDVAVREGNVLVGGGKEEGRRGGMAIADLLT